MKEDESVVQEPRGDAAAQPQLLPDATAPTQEQMKTSMAIAELRRRFRSGATWFYWIAGLSLINTLVLMFHGRFFFVAGLAATQIVGEITSKPGGVAGVIGLLVNLSIAGVYILFGYCATSRMKWAFIAGMILYGLDAVVFLTVREYIAVAFHAYALYSIYGGLKADGVLKQIEAQLQRQPVQE